MVFPRNLETQNGIQSPFHSIWGLHVMTPLFSLTSDILPFAQCTLLQLVWPTYCSQTFQLQAHLPHDFCLHFASAWGLSLHGSVAYSLTSFGYLYKCLLLNFPDTSVFEVPILLHT
jgi:hypothetical protein